MSTPPPAPLNYVEVDLDAITHNARALKQHIGPGVALIAVVKANAYGHGAVPVARAALSGGAERLAVARVSEGVELREAGLEAPILLLGYTLPADAPTIVAHGLTATVNTAEGAAALAEAAAQHATTATVHVKVDTGMGRYGLLPDEAGAFVTKLAAHDRLHVEGLYTHFAVADLPDKAYTYRQFERYQRALAAVSAAGVGIPLRHVANSAAALELPEMHLDAVRVGIALYGLRPNADVAPPVELRPALSLHSHVARVRTLPAGESISYGRTYITERPTTVALVPVGYGDGYPRLLSNRAHVLIGGQRAPIVGRVCMDQFVVDVSHIPGVAQDAPVTLLGEQGEGRITAEELAAHAETINYEMTTGLLPRLPRLYTGTPTLQ